MFRLVTVDSTCIVLYGILRTGTFPSCSLLSRSRTPPAALACLHPRDTLPGTLQDQLQFYSDDVYQSVFCLPPFLTWGFLPKYNNNYTVPVSDVVTKSSTF
jgi:hypothetical protein